MRTTLSIAVIIAALFALLAPRTAAAWDGPQLWYMRASDAQPGGSGIIATGGVLDHNVTCANCHLKAESKIDVKFTFSPALPTVGRLPTYTAGQKYQVTATLEGEHLGLANCGQYTSNVNNFAATFEDAGGKFAGVIASDSGQSSANCPVDPPPNPINGSTVTYRDCHAIIGTGGTLTQWNFTWTAPAASAGPLTLYYGAVDGNCDMMSMNDDVKTGTMKIGAPTAAITP